MLISQTTKFRKSRSKSRSDKEILYITEKTSSQNV